jgi:hypothetical protein
MKERLPKLVLSDQEEKAVVKILKDAQNGEKGSREPLRKLFDQHPALIDSWGDLAEVAQRSVVSMAADGDPLREESMHRWVTDMQEGLEMPGDGELERLLIHRLVISWLAVNSGEDLRVKRWGKGMTLADATFWDRHVSRLDADFQRGCRTLAEIRRLARPTVLAQMNIAEKQQINITAAPQPIEAADAEELES